MAATLFLAFFRGRGAGALIVRLTVAREVIACENLGPEAVRRIEVRGFPAVVANDAHGGDLFREGTARYRKT